MRNGNGIRIKTNLEISNLTNDHDDWVTNKIMRTQNVWWEQATRKD